MLEDPGAILLDVANEAFERSLHTIGQCLYPQITLQIYYIVSW